jgi:beta-glucosidase
MRTSKYLLEITRAEYSNCSLREGFFRMNRPTKPAAQLLRMAAAIICVSSLFLIIFLDTARAQEMNSAAPKEEEVQKRAQDLLMQMTLDEKIGQMSQQFFFGPSKDIENAVSQGHLGSLLLIKDAPTINRLQHLAVEKTRLHIPLLFGFDVIHGLRTVFPVPIAMAASWDPTTVENAQGFAAKEARAVGINWTFAPMVDIARDPRWGRIVEGAGEDPFLGEAIARAQVRGFQGPFVGSQDHVLACVKHFAGYGAAEGGRDYDASYIPDDQMWNVYLPPFHAAVQAGTASLMSAYMDLNDVPATGNRWLLHDVLRDAWGFKGFVVSDAVAVRNLTTHGFAMDDKDAAVRAISAGVDMEMAMGSNTYNATVAESLRTGKLTEKELDDSVLLLLVAKIRMGLFEHPYVDETKVEQAMLSSESRKAARIAATRSAVLLKNQDKLLPLKKNALHRIAIIGPSATSQTDTVGPWSLAADPKDATTILDGIQATLPKTVQVEYAQGVQTSRLFPSIFDVIFKTKTQTPWTAAEAAGELKKAVDLAKASDVTILVLGESQNMSGEAASRSSLDLLNGQEQLLEAVVAAGKPVVLVLVNGRPLNISWAAEHVSSILEVWYPGVEGGNAVADLLFGDATPGGKLPVTWPRNVGQVPIYYAHNLTQAPENQGQRYWNEPSTPLFPFGFGLSYTTFTFSNLQLDHAEIAKTDKLVVSVDVENTGVQAGDEVAQLYIHQKAGSASRPVRELKGFDRVALAPHEKKTIRFTLGKDELTYWSTAEKKWVVEPEQFDVWVGDDATATLHATFKIHP